MRISGLIDRASKSMIDTRHPLRSLARWPRWLVACQIGKPVVARFATGGIRMRLAPKLHSFGSTALFIRRDEYEPELLALRRLIKPGDTVLDIGGSYGVFTLFMAHFVGADGRVYSFEPGHFSFSQISSNIALNGFDARIALHNVAASNQPGKLRLLHHGDSPVNFSIGSVNEGVESEEVAAERVDSLVPAQSWPAVSFIKIDVEGFEAVALEGARGILELAHPTIMFEVSEAALARQGMTMDDMFQYLAAYGYSFWMLDANKAFVRTGKAQEGNVFASVHDLSAV